MRTVMAVALLAMLSHTALANDDATACKPDVFRLCSSHIPWKDKIVACLHENKRKLSPACHQVFNRKPSRHAKPAQSEIRPTTAQYAPGSLQ